MNADVNYQNEFEQSALSESVMVGNYDIAYYLLLKGADYHRPIFYRPDYSVPSEKMDPNDKGTPIYLTDLLKEITKNDFENYKYKILIEDFLANTDREI